MGYRIHVGIVKKKELKEYLKKKEEYFGLQASDIELNDNTPIQQFKVIEQYKDDEYEPYVLNKKDFQKIIDYYKNFIHEDYSNHDKDMKMMRWHIERYFNKLKIQNKNIETAGLFLIDYFYLVNLYETIKEDECFIITHG